MPAWLHNQEGQCQSHDIIFSLLKVDSLENTCPIFNQWNWAHSIGIILQASESQSLETLAHSEKNTQKKLHIPIFQNVRACSTFRGLMAPQLLHQISPLLLGISPLWPHPKPLPSYPHSAGWPKWFLDNRGGGGCFLDIGLLEEKMVSTYSI